MNGGQRIPSAQGGLGDVAAAGLTVGSLDGMRGIATLGLFRVRLDLRFLTNWISSECIGRKKVTGVYLHHEAVIVI